VVGRHEDFPGPGVESVVVHVAAAVLTVAAQLRADRPRGSVLASLAIFAVTGIVLWTQWWD
jgi:hypothetical protein